MINKLTENRFRILSGSMLKLLAIISMTIDHSAVILYPVIDAMRVPISIGGRAITLYWVMRKLGRLAFPIFCFLISEGYAHTGNKVRYGLRLLIFALVSELPFNLLHGNRWLDASGQNVFFTLLLGLILIHAYEAEVHQLLKFLVMAAVCTIAVVLKADYGLYGALLVLVIHLFRNAPCVQPLLAYPLLSGEIAACAAFVPIHLYNGKRGFIRTPFLKFSFYAFYPAHILVLYGIRYLRK